jgi:NAD dependent epimerase/dehydratase
MTSFWMGRKVLITGAGGFIGSHLSEQLFKAGAVVTCMVHYDSRASYSNLSYLGKEVSSNLNIISGDICDPFFVRGAVKEQDTVFHLAALIGIPYSYIAPQSYVKTNVEGTLNVLEACKSEGVRRLIHTSTSETYGTALYTPIDEKHPLQGQSPYSASKIGADKMAESYYLSFDLPVTTLRPFNTYGPRQSGRAVIPTMISQILASDLDFVELGDTETIRDFNYVLDTANAFMKAAESDATIGKVLNAGTGRSVTIKQCFDLIQKITGIEKPIKRSENRIRPSKSEVFNLLADSNLLSSLSGWNPSHTLEEGLSQSIEFIKKNPGLYRIGNYEV